MKFVTFKLAELRARTMIAMMQPEAMRKRKGRFPWINLSAFGTRTLTRAIDNDKATNAMHVVAMMMERNT